MGLKQYRALRVAWGDKDAPRLLKVCLGGGQVEIIHVARLRSDQFHGQPCASSPFRTYKRPKSPTTISLLGPVHKVS
jgi:hypothetical protein